MSHFKDSHDGQESCGFESPTGHCDKCNDIVGQDELLAHKGCCSVCNPAKSVNIDIAMKEAGRAFYVQQTASIIKQIISEDRPGSLEDLHNNFWLRVGNDKTLKSMVSEFKEPLRLATEELVRDQIFKDTAA